MSAPKLAGSRLNPFTIEQARTLQCKGRTFTEISKALGVDRSLIVNALYWEAGPAYVAIDIAHRRRPFAGKDSA